MKPLPRLLSLKKLKPLVALAFCILLAGCGSGVMVPSYTVKDDGSLTYYPADSTICISIFSDTLAPVDVSFGFDSLEPITGMDLNVFDVDSGGKTIRQLKRDGAVSYVGEGDSYRWTDTGMIDIRQLPDSFITLEPMGNTVTFYYRMPGDTAKFIHVSATIRTMKNGKANIRHYEADFRLTYTESSGGMGKIFCEALAPSSKSKPSAPYAFSRRALSFLLRDPSAGYFSPSCCA